jgi:hypothetical protein
VTARHKLNLLLCDFCVELHDLTSNFLLFFF